jgi:hypothetical protein
MLTASTNHTKLGFETLEVIINSMTNEQQKIVVTLQLLATDSQAKREGGNLWWDDCVWHPELLLQVQKPAVTNAVPIKKEGL